MPGNMVPPDDIWYDPSYREGEYSYADNVKRMSSHDFASVFPKQADGSDWGTATGESIPDTLWNNVVTGEWLPVFIPEGFEGDIPGPNPEYILDASNTVNTLLDNSYGPANSSADADQQRWDQACRMAIEAASMTAGSPLVRE